MAELTPGKRAKLPDSAFAYIDSSGVRRLPINDESHTRNAIARFGRMVFEDDAARERARKRLLTAARKYGIVPIGFMSGQIARERVLGRGDTVAAEMRRLPRGMVTFLLTDIEGSTSLLGRLGDGYPQVLDRVRSLLRGSVTAAGGIEVDARADELFAVFGTPLPALEAAVAIQRVLRAEPWPTDIEVCVRIGLHMGRPTVTDSGYVGIAVNTAARVCSSAHGGQIVVTVPVRDALDDADERGMTFRDLGAHRLHGLPDAIQLFQLDVDDLAHDFPPLRVFASPPVGAG